MEVCRPPISKKKKKEERHKNPNLPCVSSAPMWLLTPSSMDQRRDRLAKWETGRGPSRSLCDLVWRNIINDSEAEEFI